MRRRNAAGPPTRGRRVTARSLPPHAPLRLDKRMHKHMHAADHAQHALHINDASELIVYSWIIE